MMLCHRRCNIPFSLSPNAYSSLSNIQLKSASPLTLRVWSGFLKSDILADSGRSRWVKPRMSHILLFSKNLNFKILGRMGKSLAHYKTIDEAYLAADLSQFIQRLESEWMLLLTTCLSACRFQYFYVRRSILRLDHGHQQAQGLCLLIFTAKVFGNLFPWIHFKGKSQEKILISLA